MFNTNFSSNKTIASQGKTLTRSKGYEGVQKAHDCAHHFSASVSTNGIKGHLPNIHHAINTASKKAHGCENGNGYGIPGLKSAIREVVSKIENLMGSLENQAGGKGACGAAAQMTTMVTELEGLGAAQKPSNKEIIQLLNQISSLLQKLENTIHTSTHANIQFGKKGW